MSPSQCRQGADTRNRHDPLASPTALVRYCLDAATQKLGAANSRPAASVAIWLGLIDGSYERQGEILRDQSRNDRRSEGGMRFRFE
ncbi:hypothetical protein [Mesorhizobium sp. M0676]|uniref:hypothetical protein n=1 Tax=Mesorhizobium sp. M0676 TaxID=2956984 RepID=UPI00333CDBA0